MVGLSIRRSTALYSVMLRKIFAKLPARYSSDSEIVQHTTTPAVRTHVNITRNAKPSSGSQYMTLSLLSCRLKKVNTTIKWRENIVGSWSKLQTSDSAIAQDTTTAAVCTLVNITRNVRPSSGSQHTELSLLSWRLRKQNMARKWRERIVDSWSKLRIFGKILLKFLGDLW